MIEIDPEAHIGVFDDVGLKDYNAELFDAPVDVVSREVLKSYIRPAPPAVPSQVHSPFPHLNLPRETY